jgi:hypothetical protein
LIVLVLVLEFMNSENWKSSQPPKAERKAKKIFGPERIQEGKGILLRVVSMLCKLVERFDTGGELREDSPEYCISEAQNSEMRLEEERISRTRTRTRTRTN